MLHLDHITIVARSLAEGVAHAERALGVTVPAGGAHPLMGTHNHLLRLGPALFLEVIAIDPGAATPGRPRWFALDDPRMQASVASSPRLATWVAGTTDIAATLAALPGAAGPPIRVTRGTLEWLISVPDDGSMPFDGAFPTLIEWPAGPHPASRMADHGCSLAELRIGHPRIEAIRAALAPVLPDPRIRYVDAAAPSLAATIKTPQGERILA